MCFDERLKNNVNWNMRRIFNKRKADILVTILEKINDKNYKIVDFVDLIFKKKENAEKSKDTIWIYNHSWSKENKNWKCFNKTYNLINNKYFCKI